MTPTAQRYLRYLWYPATTTTLTWPIFWHAGSSTASVGCKCGCEREDDCHDKKKKPNAG